MKSEHVKKNATIMPIICPGLQKIEALGIQLIHLSFSIQHEQTKRKGKRYRESCWYVQVP